jgi:hypothetical protein
MSGTAFDPDTTPDPFGLPEINTGVLDPTNTEVFAVGDPEARTVHYEKKEHSDATG